MAPQHQYDRVSESDDLSKEGDAMINEEPRFIRVQVGTPWWKLVVCNLVALFLGGALMYAITRSGVVEKVVSSPATTSAAALVTASSTSSVVPEPTEKPKLSFNIPSDPGAAMYGKILDCGGNPQQAREKGCIYDVMMQDWVPKPCYDEKLTQEYLKKGNWTWYADGQGERIMSDEEMALGEHGRAWMSNSYHKAHCVFSWLKIIRALRTHSPLTNELISYDHVMHCKMGALRESSTDENLGVMAPTNYARCALYETWALDFPEDNHDPTEK